MTQLAGYPLAGGNPIGGPEEAINQKVEFGDCFAFDGDQGNLTVRLERPIRPTAITLEHLNKAYGSEGGKSAPRSFVLWGYVDEKDLKSEDGGQVLVEGEYDITSADTIQTFRGLSGDGLYEFTRLQVNSNYGQKYTCVYRFRVHAD